MADLSDAGFLDKARTLTRNSLGALAKKIVLEDSLRIAGDVSSSNEARLDAAQSLLRVDPEMGKRLVERLIAQGLVVPVELEQVHSVHRGLLRLVSVLLPGDQREEWLEENRAYLGDIDGSFGRCWWVVGQLLAMPRYAYTVRTDAKKESA
jgi:hypothetical protein